MSRELFVAYFRVGTGRQGRSQLGLLAQQRAVADYLDGGERELAGEFTEVESGQRCGRPQLACALEACHRHNATLIIARLDRLARDASVLFSIFDGADCEVVFCDPPQTAPARTRSQAARAEGAGGSDAGPARRWRRAGRTSANMAAAGCLGWAEPAAREQQADRRTAAVARRLADQRAAKTLPIVRALQASGVDTLQGVADALNARGVPTARGARWYPTTVKNLLGRGVREEQQAAL